MSELKRFELTVEANNFEGSQTFACYAYSKSDAKDRFRNGECAIIDESIEVLGLEREPTEIEESDDISSRLWSDVAESKDVEIAKLQAEKAELVKFVTEIAECWNGSLSGRAQKLLNKLQ